MSGEISFFEIGTGDAEKARAFYCGLFDSDGASRPVPRATASSSRPVACRAGSTRAMPARRCTPSSAVPDLDAAITRVQELGGERQVPGRLRRERRGVRPLCPLRRRPGLQLRAASAASRLRFPHTAVAALDSETSGGRSSVGRAPGCGPGGRGFESRRSPSESPATADFPAVVPDQHKRSGA